MTDSKDENGSTLKLGGPKRLQLNKTVAAGQVKQSFSHGRTNTVKVERRRKRVFERGAAGDMNAVAAEAAEAAQIPAAAPATARPAAAPQPAPMTTTAPEDGLSEAERRNRMRALASATAAERMRLQEMEEAERREAARRQAEQEEEDRRRAEAEARRQAEEEARRAREPAETRGREPQIIAPPGDDEEERGRAAARGRGLDKDKDKDKKAVEKKAAAARSRDDARRRKGKLTISQALEQDGSDTRVRSLAALRRAKEKERQRAKERRGRHEKIVRDVVVPESITVSDLANRMAERVGDTIKAFMKMGVMVTQNQVLDADTAELVATELGHRVRRVAESDVEIGIHGELDRPEELQSRPPVVAVMGHVDHGKTSLLDALRHTDVAGGEAGGITQHIGAYQVTLESGNKITFLDTPGHAAFTQMRMRGATVTDLVVLVVAADDGIQPQTREAVSHARAAGTPIIVAINKCDRPDADPARVRTQLLELELVPEELGGDVLCIEVSALKKQNLDKLEDAILLQAEMLELTANPNRQAAGAVVEARLERGRGAVATLLVQQGTLRVGDVVVAGAEWGRVRALLDDRGRAIESAGPCVPVEILGLQGAPRAGDDFVVPADEAKAREVADYRRRKIREKELTMVSRGSLEQMFDRISAGEAKELAVVIKADVQGSLEAIITALEKLSGDEVKVRILHGAVGGVTESDISLAASTDGLAIGFNVRANPQARDMARRDGVDIRYYSVIYDLIAEVKGVLDGLLAPEERENILGYAQIREVFSVSKFGKAAGCMVTEGMVRRGGRVRLLRDDVVIHEGTLKSLRRFKEDVREVKHGFECGISFENYQDIRPGDRVECFEIEHLARVS